MNLVNTGSGNGLVTVQHPTIARANADLLLLQTLEKL